MTILMKDGKPALTKHGDVWRVPGRAILKGQVRKGILSIADLMSVSVYKTLKKEDRALFMKDAFKAKGKFEKSANYHKIVIGERWKLEGMTETLVTCACNTVAAMQSKLPTYGYPQYWVKKPDIMDNEDIDSAKLNANLTSGMLPYSARLVRLVVSRDCSKGLFTTREIIDAHAKGRQFRWKAFVVDNTDKPKEVLEDHAYELERPAFIDVAEVHVSGFLLKSMRGEIKV